MSDAEKKGTKIDPNTEAVAALGVAWIELARLLIQTNALSKEDIQAKLTECMEVAERADQATAKSIYWALRGSLNDA